MGASDAFAKTTEKSLSSFFSSGKLQAHRVSTREIQDMGLVQYLSSQSGFIPDGLALLGCECTLDGSDPAAEPLPERRTSGADTLKFGGGGILAATKHDRRTAEGKDSGLESFFGCEHLKYSSRVRQAMSTPGCAMPTAVRPKAVPLRNSLSSVGESPAITSEALHLRQHLCRQLRASCRALRRNSRTWRAR